MDEASTPTIGYVKVLFPLHPRAIVIQRNSMDPVVADVDNDGLLLPPPNRRISFVSARPPTPTVHRKFRKFRLAQFRPGSTTRADREIDTNRFRRSKSLPPCCLSGNRDFSKWIVLLIRFREDRCDRRGRI